MGILSIILVLVIVLSARTALSVRQGKLKKPEDITRKIASVRQVGLFGLIIGILGQLIGLFSAFQAIELGQVDVSPTILASGFKVSMITTMYGLLIYAIALLLGFGLKIMARSSD